MHIIYWIQGACCFLCPNSIGDTLKLLACGLIISFLFLCNDCEDDVSRSLCAFFSKLQSKAGRPVNKRTRAEEVMHLAVVACGNRLEETLTLVKSALLFSLKKIKFHIFAEDPLAPQFKEKVRRLQSAQMYTHRACGVFSPGQAWHHSNLGNDFLWFNSPVFSGAYSTSLLFNAAHVHHPPTFCNR